MRTPVDVSAHTCRVYLYNRTQMCELSCRSSFQTCVDFNDGLNRFDCKQFNCPFSSVHGWCTLFQRQASASPRRRNIIRSIIIPSLSSSARYAYRRDIGTLAVRYRRNIDAISTRYRRDITTMSSTSLHRQQKSAIQIRK